MDLTVVILAAGKGTRMRSDLPKVLHPIGGKAMLCHVVDVAKMLNPRNIVIVYGEDKAALQDAVADDTIAWVHQRQQLGTADAVRCAMSEVGDESHVLVLYGDVPLISLKTLSRLIRLKKQSAVSLITAHVEDPTGLGRIIRDSNGHIQAIVEEKDASDEQKQIHEVNTGIFLLAANKLKPWLGKINNQNAQNEFYLTDVIKLGVSEGVEIQSCVPDIVDEINGVNTRAQLSTLERFYQRSLANTYLEQGVHIFDPNRFDVRGELNVGKDVSIDVNVVFEGRVQLGDRVKIGPNCVLKDCQIGHDVEIKAFSHIDEAVVEERAVIGPYARLRPGAWIDKEAYIGNFVEVKKSRVGPGSKVNHLSYIGDSYIGAQVNIGAGTITCNYDGAYKHQTTIEDNVFIGSCSALVAPVTIKTGATIAAGSVVTKDAPAYQLTLTHQLRQRSVDWRRPSKTKAEEELALTKERG